MRRDVWTTYRVTCYTFDIGGDPRSQGGVHLHRVRFKSKRWQTRICQSNGNTRAYGQVRNITNAEGEIAWALAKEMVERGAI